MSCLTLLFVSNFKIFWFVFICILSTLLPESYVLSLLKSFTVDISRLACCPSTINDLIGHVLSSLFLLMQTMSNSFHFILWGLHHAVRDLLKLYLNDIEIPPSYIVGISSCAMHGLLNLTWYLNMVEIPPSYTEGISSCSATF